MAELQRRVVDTEASLGQKQQENATLREQLQQYEAKMKEMEEQLQQSVAKMKRTEDMLQKQTASLQVSLCACRLPLLVTMT